MPTSQIASHPSASNLRLYLDTAEINEHERWLPTGLFYGITCNPLLLERAQVPCRIFTLSKLAQRAIALGAKEVHLQAWGSSAKELVSIGTQLRQIHSCVIVKLPATLAGTTAASTLIASGIPITLTAVYEPRQVLIAAAIGASYVAPYLGRITDAGKDGLGIVASMQQMLNSTHSQTRLLTASIRDVDHICQLAAQGVDTFTFSAAIAQAFFNVPATTQAVADFERAAQTMRSPTTTQPTT